MKVFVQIVDTKTGKYEHAMIDEPVIKGHEVNNAVSHLIGKALIEWNSDFIYEDVVNTPRLLTGTVCDTNKVLNVVCYEEEQIPSSEKNSIV